MLFFCSGKGCQFGSAPNDVFIYCRLCNIVLHPKCARLVGRVKDYINLRIFSLPAVPICTKSSGGVPVSVSQPKGSNTTQLSVPTGEVSSIGVHSIDSMVAEERASRLFHIGRTYLCLV